MDSDLEAMFETVAVSGDVPGEDTDDDEDEEGGEDESGNEDGDTFVAESRSV